MPISAQAQDFSYTTSAGGVTIVGYTGAGGDAVIPSTIAGLPVTMIRIGAFNGRTSLTSVTIPHSVTNIGGGPNIRDHEGRPGEGRVFSYCTSLDAIHVDPLNPVYSSLDGVLFNKSQTWLIQYPGGRTGGYIIPPSVTSVQHNAFVGCTRLTSVTMGDNVADIGPNAFKNCSALASITLGNSVARIGIEAFSACTSLTNIVIPQSVTNIGYGSWVFVEGFVFTHCTSLNAIVVDPNNPAYSSLASCSTRAKRNSSSILVPERATI